ncbi:DUF202 domain-containing protein [Blastococcus sp. VKM Ac-2987]|uniref:DUF202 domain-containing protein n=1 Tax=Blastococcus sp. VKM Ac-2987 TaxID=3004141 RepID=UPI0022AB960B|nr:DUF202 domain-containing protein [Blastococcus sp. VKM Ac-2987]MCZ2858228.1 DUF202 domain-containing protein [Blastococcus sp. VKM Ac-2987]
MTAVETQPERTALAWQRTGLGVLAVAALLGHRALGAGRPALLVAAGLTALLGLGVLGGLAPARYRQVRDRVAGGRAVTTPAPARAVTAVVVLTALAAAVAVLVPG